MVKRKKTPATRTAVTTVKPEGLKILLGIEVDPTAGPKTLAEIALGKAGDGDDPFTGYTFTQEYKGGDIEKEGVLYFKELAAGTLNEKVVRVRGCKTNVLADYDKNSGATTFYDNYYLTTEELLAEVYIFQKQDDQDDQCLTGGTKTFEERRKEMESPTKPGINKVLIRLDKNGSSIKDCIIDGVVHWKDGNELAKTER